MSVNSIVNSNNSSQHIIQPHVAALTQEQRVMIASLGRLMRGCCLWNRGFCGKGLSCPNRHICWDCSGNAAVSLQSIIHPNCQCPNRPAAPIVPPMLAVASVLILEERD
jgi:hypothetical protein